MSKRIEKARELRSIKEPHYNCCQIVFMSFCEELGIDEKTAFDLGVHFGGGMRVKATCGSISGAIMAMGMLKSSKEDVTKFMIDFERRHGTLNCDKLLEKASDSYPKSQLCSELIYECIEEVEKIISSADSSI